MLDGTVRDSLLRHPAGRRAALAALRQEALRAALIPSLNATMVVGIVQSWPAPRRSRP